MDKLLFLHKEKREFILICDMRHICRSATKKRKLPKNGGAGWKKGGRKRRKGKAAMAKSILRWSVSPSMGIFLDFLGRGLKNGMD